MKNQIPRNGDIWFTDGSKSDDGAGFRIYGPRHRDYQTYSHRKYIKVSQAELAAINTRAKKLEHWKLLV